MRKGAEAVERLERLESFARLVGRLRASQRAHLATLAHSHAVEAVRLARLVDRELGGLGIVEFAQAAIPGVVEEGEG